MKKVKKHPHAGKQGNEREFISIVNRLSSHHGFAHREILADFVEMAFHSIAKQTTIGDEAEEHEENYMRIVGARPEEYVRAMPELLGLATLEVQHGGADFLGRVSGELVALHEGAGQFFTPYEVSRMIAAVTFKDAKTLIEDRGWVSVQEPACGSGGMLIAVADEVEALGFEPSRSLFVEAVDIEWKAFMMAFVQLSLRGVPAIVHHGNTLSLEMWKARRTPAFVPFMLEHGPSWLAWRRGEKKEDSTEPEQASLFG